jgi:hypothetical protein
LNLKFWEIILRYFFHELFIHLFITMQTAKVADVLAWLQLLDIVFYFIEHSSIIAQLVQQKSINNIPPLTNAMSIMFLCILCPTVLFCAAMLVFIRVKRRIFVAPSATALIDVTPMAH